MDSGKILEDSFRYAKEGLAGKWDTWLLLIISCVIFPLYLGYLIRIYRGAYPSPRLDNWGSMFFDGIKLVVIGLIYISPIFILEIVLFASTGLVDISSANQSAVMGFLLIFLIGWIIIVTIAVLIWLIITTAFVRFARAGNFTEAFNFRKIFNHIGRIGWMDYIIALLMMLIVLGIITIVCVVIPFIGTILLLILLPFMGLFSARYITLLYESAGPE